MQEITRLCFNYLPFFFNLLVPHTFTHLHTLYKHTTHTHDNTTNIHTTQDTDIYTPTLYTHKCANYIHITPTCYTHSILTTSIVCRYIHTLHTLYTLKLALTPHIDGSLWDRVIKILEQFKNKTLSQSCSLFSFFLSSKILSAAASCEAVITGCC